VLLRTRQPTDIVPGHGGILDFVVDAVEFAMQCVRSFSGFENAECRMQNVESKSVKKSTKPWRNISIFENKTPMVFFSVLYSTFYIPRFVSQRQSVAFPMPE
jgi:hypothetical protein